MLIKFLGTGAAEGIPAVFCNCEFCKAVRFCGEAEFRTRSQVVIDDCLSVDFPPDAFMHSLKHGIELGKIRYLLATHSHMDHFYAHDFILRGYKYAVLSEPELEIYGNSEVKKVFDECTAREMKPEVSEHVKVNVVKPYSIFFVGDYKVIAIPANHSKTEDALLFYIEKNGKGYLHLYDTGIITDSAFDFLKENGAKADLVCFDCTFADNRGSVTARHMGIYEDMQMKNKLIERGIISDMTKLIISHFSHNAKPSRARLTEIEDKFGVTAAYDGFTVEL